MPFRAVRLCSLGVCSVLDRVQDVAALGVDTEVADVIVRRVSIVVAHVHPWGNLAYEHLCDETVDQLPVVISLVAEYDMAVSIL